MPDDSEKEEFLNVGDVPKLSDIIAQIKIEEEQLKNPLFQLNTNTGEIKQVDTGWSNDEEVKLLPQDKIGPIVVPQEILDEMAKNKLSDEEKAQLDKVFSKVLKNNLKPIEKQIIRQIVQNTEGLHPLPPKKKFPTKFGEKVEKILNPEPEPDLLDPVVDPKTDMWWHPKNGEKKLVSQMETSHMFFALRMLFNQVCPKGREMTTKGQTISKVKVHADETKDTIKILCHQIMKREDLTDNQLDDLAYMARILKEEVK